jgi:hypothetical protein
VISKRLLPLLAAPLLLSAQPAVARATGSEVIEVGTVPQVAGIVFTVDGVSLRTGADGRVRIRVAPGRQHLIALHQFVSPRRGVRAEFLRWQDGRRTLRRSIDGFTGVHQLRAAYAVTKRTRFVFVTPQGSHVDPRTIDSASLLRSDGRHVVLRSLTPQWLAARTVAPGHIFRTLRFHYALESVTASGSNVVNRGQQRFLPGGRVEVSVLFYRVHLRARDAFFGFPIGSSVSVTYPDGHATRLILEDGNAVTQPLPRGDYVIKVDVSGVGTTHDIVVSRDSEAAIRILSVYDALAVVAAFLLASAVLYLVGRKGQQITLRPARDAGLRKALKIGQKLRQLRGERQAIQERQSRAEDATWREIDPAIVELQPLKAESRAIENSDEPVEHPEWMQVDAAIAELQPQQRTSRWRRRQLR